MWHQIVGTAMGTNFASPYTCLPLGFQKATSLPIHITNHAIEITLSKPVFTPKSEIVQEINFLAITIFVTKRDWSRQNECILQSPYNISNAHVNDKRPRVVAERIILFTGDGDLEEENSKDLKGWLLECGFPLNIIDKGMKGMKGMKPIDEQCNPTSMYIH